MDSRTQRKQVQTILNNSTEGTLLEKLPFGDENNQADRERLQKKVEITLHHGEFNYIYLEFSNGERIRLVRSVIKK
jgi:hypothetical protein